MKRLISGGVAAVATCWLPVMLLVSAPAGAQEQVDVDERDGLRVAVTELLVRHVVAVAVTERDAVGRAAGRVDR